MFIKEMAVSNGHLKNLVYIITKRKQFELVINDISTCCEEYCKAQFISFT